MLGAAAVADVQPDQVETGFPRRPAGGKHVRGAVAGREAMHRQDGRTRTGAGFRPLQVQPRQDLRIRFGAKEPGLRGPAPLVRRRRPVPPGDGLQIPMTHQGDEREQPVFTVEDGGMPRSRRRLNRLHPSSRPAER